MISRLTRNPKRPATWMGALMCMLLSGCRPEHSQSALHPAGPASESIAWLSWLLMAICGVVFVLVLLLLTIALLRQYRDVVHEPPLGNTGFIVLGGIVLPAVVLSGFLYLSLDTSVALEMPEHAMTIEVIGHMWWWEVRYPQQGIVTANELHIPVGEAVRVEVRAHDVIHSFWVPNLSGKVDMLPEITNISWIQADRAGTYRGQCAEYCGLQHALMAFVVVALPRDEFDAWVEERLGLQPDEGLSEQQERGREVFYRAACNNCHAIRGTRATGLIGPDLTHIATRVTLGAGTIPNNRGNLAGWVANPQPIKPGNRMPPSYLAADDLHALLAYLEHLK